MDSLEKALGEIERGKPAGYYLVWGEEFLARKAADALVERLVPEELRALNQLTLDGASPKELAQELQTFPLFPGRKLVLTRDPEFLAPKKGRGAPLAGARDAWRANRRKEAARRLLALAARAGWGIEEVDPVSAQAAEPAQWKSELNVELSDADVAFLKEAAAYCRAEGIRAPENDEGPLTALLEKGLDKDQLLVIVASEVDAKHPLVRLAKEKGCLIERKVAQRLKELDIAALAKQVLAPHKKRLSPAAESKLKERCGANMRLLESELEKLALYSTGATIEVVDVELLVHHAREDEFLELSDALQKRDLKAALRYASDALGQGASPLMLLGAVTSIVRTLIASRERLSQLCGDSPPRSYNDFQANVFPKIEAEAKAKRTRLPHPYAAFMGMQAAAGYTRKALLDGLRCCADADLALKLGGGPLVVERLLWTLCGAASAPDAPVAAAR